MRWRALVLAASMLASALLIVTTDPGEARSGRPPARTCHRRHGHRVCTAVHPKRRPKPRSGTHGPGSVTTQTTSTTSTDTATGSTSQTATTSTQTSATQTSATETTTTSTSTAAALPHGTEVDERATGEADPLYAMNADEPTLAAGTIHFNVYNFDQDPHTFAIANADGVQITNAVSIPADQPETPVTVTVDLPPGTYTLFCTLPMHAELGMKTTIVVR